MVGWKVPFMMAETNAWMPGWATGTVVVSAGDDAVVVEAVGVDVVVVTPAVVAVAALVAAVGLDAVAVVAVVAVAVEVVVAVVPAAVANLALAANYSAAVGLDAPDWRRDYFAERLERAEDSSAGGRAACP